MPPIEEADLNQRAVLWQKTGVDASNETLLDSPQDVWCEWNEKEGEATDSQGNTVSLSAVVGAVVDVDEEEMVDVPVGSQMWLAPDASESALDQWYETGSAGIDAEVMEVRTKSKTKDLSGRVTRYEYGLAKYRHQRGELD